MKIAVVTSANAASLSHDDQILLPALQRAGYEPHHWQWDGDHDWASMDLALIRSTWDYFQRPEEFRAWLAETKSKVAMANSASVLEWNFDKRYLLELQAAGLPVLPAVRCTPAEVAEAVAEIWEAGDTAIAKPVIGGGAWGLSRMPPGSPIEFDATLGDFLVQKFVEEIVEDGEISVVVLAGQARYCLRKLPKAGDIRVQKEHGGRYQREELTEELTELAHQLVAACPEPPLYGRVDVVKHKGVWQLMELELFEPELFFSLFPEGADILAAELGEFVGR